MSKLSQFDEFFAPVTLEHALGLMIKDDNVRIFKKVDSDRIYYIFKEDSSEELYESTLETQGRNPFIEVNKEKLFRSELSSKTCYKLSAILENKEEYITSKSEESDIDSLMTTSTSDTSDAVYSTVIRHMKYPPIKKVSDITTTKFMTDKEYTLSILFRELSQIPNMDDLLSRMKKCLVYVLMEGKWYCWRKSVV